MLEDSRLLLLLPVLLATSGWARRYVVWWPVLISGWECSAFFSRYSLLPPHGNGHVPGSLQLTQSPQR
ncbi:hypothetical protein L2M29_004084 [Salmonella enterica]|nr:hypothetical protein [Salmonella enterica]